MSEPTADQPPAWIADEDHCREVLEGARVSDFPAFAEACRARPEANGGPWHLLIDAQGRIHCGEPWHDGQLRVFTEPASDKAGEDAVTDAREQILRAFNLAREARTSAEAITCWNDATECAEWLGAQNAAGGASHDALVAVRETRFLKAAATPYAAPEKQTRTATEAQPPFTGSYAQLRLLRGHVVNLTEGRLSREGMMTSDDEQLRHIAQEIARFAGDGTARVMLFAHGGLVSEKAGLASAWAYREWWKANGIYPVWFVWETGLMETLYRLLSFERRPAGRGIGDILTELSDKAIEAAARPLARPIWSAMKRSAEAASAADGGARGFVEILEGAARDKVALYGVGHSAGSIFLAHLLRPLDDSGLKFEQLHLLAPAITTGDFERLAAKQLGTWGTAISLFAMDADTERADSCADIYRKSLLYLVSNALEEHRREPLVGLQESFDHWDKRPPMESFFGPLPEAGNRRDATRSTSHGGFDDDPATMESVALRILGADGSNPPECRFPERQARYVAPPASPPNFYGIDPETIRNAPHRSLAAGGGTAPPQAAPIAIPASISGSGGTRRALCFGNNAFSGAPRLSGCINDAQAWAKALSAQGFSAETFLDCPADQMREVIRRNAEACSPGDALVIHISSHGTQVEDLDGDEAQDSLASDRLDEATLGVDYDMGGLIIDDEWPGLIAVRQGVHVTRFHDFCNSGRTSRMALYGNRTVRGVRTGDLVAQRAAERLSASGFDPVGESVHYLTFCACRPDQVAEEDGNLGIFSGFATELLAGAGAAMTARQFAEAIGQRMSGLVQIPSLEGPATMQDLPLFGGR